MIQKVLIANRGEVALRIIRACRDLGVRTVLAHSDVDRASLPAQLADETVCIGPAPPAKSYLNIPNLITAALMKECDAIHPGTGFLAENEYFAEVCEKVDLIFIGPPARVIGTMSNKAQARQEMRRAGLEVLPGSDAPLRGLEDAQILAAEIGFPVILKAVAGGGGRGIRVAFDEPGLSLEFMTAQAEALAAFGNGALYLEKYLARCRHVEIQLMADRHGNVIHLGDRECSLQRRHQKVVEEGPSVLSVKEREKLGRLAAKGAARIGYVNAGTLEFLWADGHAYFSEMNTRIQVEHGVTELLTGLDLVKEQILVASGERLSIRQEDVTLRGHAIECRITAESAEDDFQPRFGTVSEYLAPGGPGVRVESHLYAGYAVPVYYDSLLAKLLTWGKDRAEAIARMDRALAEYRIEGVTTLIPFQRRIMADPNFRAGDVYTRYLETMLAADRERKAEEARKS
ncbi:MAG TPA: acetyl-CoA carboxylase biotin carboxylase subunit [Chloroflexota bacterium]|nr:acetyl-CoA carboxylase biotin carboxylase subunit [Chloroflexota bacterium]